MRQSGDDLKTRELHMILVANGHLFHSIASGWADATNGLGTVFQRFSTVSPWTDIGLQLGLGKIHSAAIVAERAGVSFFVGAADSGGVYRIWHLRRTGNGTWLPARDVLALSGDAPNGSVYPFNVAAGRCPKFAAEKWDEASSETVLALWNGSAQREVLVIRVTGDGSYSAWRPIPVGDARVEYVQDVRVGARPFADTGSAYP
jgi:hypothetical protein